MTIKIKDLRAGRGTKFLASGDNEAIESKKKVSDHDSWDNQGDQSEYERSFNFAWAMEHQEKQYKKINRTVSDANLIGSRWVCKKKNESNGNPLKYKSRVTSLVHQKRYGVDMESHSLQYQWTERIDYYYV